MGYRPEKKFEVSRFREGGDLHAARDKISTRVIKAIQPRSALIRRLLALYAFLIQKTAG